jgi:hypothetical protein
MAETSAVPGAGDIREGDQEVSLDFAALTKYGAVSAALAYATGMLTINIYLHELGITDFSFAKPKLILTGVLVLMTFLLLALLPVFIAIRMAEDVRPVRPHSRKMLFWLFLPLVALFGASAALCFGQKIGLGQVAVWGVWELLGTRNVAKESLASLIIAAEVYVPICVAAVSAYAATLLFKRAKSTPDTHQSVPARIYYPIVVSLAVVAVVGYIYAFSLTFYAAIPPAFGGGKPYFESFLITNDGICPLLQLGISFGEPNITEALPVLHESDNLVAVWLKSKKSADPNSPSETAGGHRVPIVVQLDKTLITGIVAASAPPTTPQLNDPQACITSSASGVAKDK